jgi:hypothetical protein
VSHEYDLLNFLFGYSKSKSRVLAESCDDYEVVGKRELNSVTFHLRGMLSLRRQMQVETMIVRYERGTVTLRICGSKAMCIIHDHEKNPGENMVDIPAPDKDWDLRMRRVTENFINSIRGTEVPYLTSVDMQLSAQIGPFLSMNADAASIV